MTVLTRDPQTLSPFRVALLRVDSVLCRSDQLELILVYIQFGLDNEPWSGYSERERAMLGHTRPRSMGKCSTFTPYKWMLFASDILITFAASLF